MPEQAFGSLKGKKPRELRTPQRMPSKCLSLRLSHLCGVTVWKEKGTSTQVHSPQLHHYERHPIENRRAMSKWTHFLGRPWFCHIARIRLFFGLCSSSQRPSASINGGTYTPNLPRKPFFNPYHPPTGLSSARPQASTVPCLAGFCSSAPPKSIQSPCDFSMACRSGIQRAS